MSIEPESKTSRTGQFRPAATLLAMATILPELFTGSTPLTAFLNPGALVFLFIGYGIAVLLVREFAVHFRSRMLGLFCLGLAYSIFNEGLLAKTLIIESHLPVSHYDHYGVWLGISFPWMAGIGVWHACASVMFPILLVHYFFPESRTVPWLNRNGAIALGAVLLFLASAAFLGNSAKNVRGTVPQLIVLLALMFAGFVAGAYFKGEMQARASTSAARPALLGLSIFVPFWGMACLASIKVLPVIFFVVLVAVISGYVWILRRQSWLTFPGFLYFGLGWYLHNVLQAAVIISFVARDPLRAALTTGVDGLILWWLHRQIRRSSANTHTVVAIGPAQS